MIERIKVDYVITNLNLCLVVCWCSVQKLWPQNDRKAELVGGTCKHHVIQRHLELSSPLFFFFVQTYFHVHLEYFQHIFLRLSLIPLLCTRGKKLPMNTQNCLISKTTTLQNVKTIWTDFLYYTDICNYSSFHQESWINSEPKHFVENIFSFYFGPLRDEKVGILFFGILQEKES